MDAKGSPKRGSPEPCVTCHTCDEKFTSKSALHKHRKEVHSSRYKCDNCEESFKDKSALSIHIQFHSNKSVACEVCSMIFNSATSLIEHIKIHKLSFHKCDLCDKTFRVRHSMTCHRRNAHSTTDYGCDQCLKTFRTRAKLVNHLVTHQKGYVCAYCKECFVTDKLRRTHYHAVHKDVSLRCDICDISYDRLCDLAYHKRFHTNESPYLCIMCLRAFRSFSDLKEHHMRHAKEAFEQSITENYKNNSNSLSALPKKRGRDGPFLCDICGKEFTRRDGLKDHRSLHGPKGSHQCNICGKIYPHLVSLKEHLKRHKKLLNRSTQKAAGEPRAPRTPGGPPCTPPRTPGIHTCNICGKIFHYANTLSTHRKTHTDRFRCHVCGRVFNKKCNMQTHILTHTGSKPHGCPYCDNRYTDRSNLKKHIAHKHSECLPPKKEEFME